MNDNSLWFGYLEAGAKSTPVVLDSRLNTGNPETLYLFNYARKQILEYSRNIVEPKLRPLSDSESTDCNDLKAVFGEACRNFRPRASGILTLPERGGPARAPKEEEEAPEEMEQLVGVADGDEDDGWADEDE